MSCVVSFVSGVVVCCLLCCALCVVCCLLCVVIIVCSCVLFVVAWGLLFVGCCIRFWWLWLFAVFFCGMFLGVCCLRLCVVCCVLCFVCHVLVVVVCLLCVGVRLLVCVDSCLVRVARLVCVVRYSSVLLVGCSLVCVVVDCCLLFGVL